MLASGRDRGFALLIVLWTLVLLSLIVTQMTAAGHGEAQLAFNLRTSARVRAQAEGVVFQAVFHLLDGSAGHWEPNNAVHQFALPGAAAEVRVENLGGRINPNTSPPELIAALMVEVGVDVRTAATLSNAVVEWRSPTEEGQADTRVARYRAAGRSYAPPGTPFQSLDELGYVLGMTPDIVARLRPHMSVDTFGDTDPTAADPQVLHALQVVGAGTEDNFTKEDRQSNMTVLITASVAARDGARAGLRAVVRVGETINGRRWRVLGWGAPDA